ncbi:MAG: hypothetical protein U5R31_07605 [Acidimicrobiia bacterium]|nr:hypothetical protein [Acidimicrobiia bacterium]
MVGYLRERDHPLVGRELGDPAVQEFVAGRPTRLVWQDGKHLGQLPHCVEGMVRIAIEDDRIVGLSIVDC